MIEQNWEYTAIVPVIRGRMLDCLAWRLHTFTSVLTKKEMDQNIWSYIPQVLPAHNWQGLGLELWKVDDMVLANQLSAAVATLSLLAAQISDLANIPKIIDSAEQVFQAYVEKQASKLSRSLQFVFDTMGAMANRFNDLPEQDQRERDSLMEAVAGLAELHELIQPSKEFDGAQSFTVDQILEYAKRLEQARPLAEGIRLLWTKDVLDHMLGAGV